MSVEPESGAPGGVRASVLPADWPAPRGVRALTTLRAPAGESAAPFDRFNLGERCGDAPASVVANRERLRRDLDLPGPPIWLHQVHGIGVARVTGEPTPDAIEADAAVTSVRGIVLAVLTADCLPVVLAARDGTEVAVAHAGWRGLTQGVLESTVRSLRARPADLHAWLGPAAGPARYEVGDEVFRAFVEVDAQAAKAFVATRPGHWNVDLFALARRRLLGVGVESVHGGGVCTISDSRRFFSHRRDAVTGRMATLAWLD